MNHLLFILFLISNPSVHAKKINSVEMFFKDAERQMETDSQCLELKKALMDLLNLNKKDIMLKKYQDYQGLPDQWTILEILKKYFVSSSSNSLNKDQFLKDFRRPQAQLAIQKRLYELGNCESGVK